MTTTVVHGEAYTHQIVTIDANLRANLCRISHALAHGFAVANTEAETTALIMAFDLRAAEGHKGVQVIDGVITSISPL